MKRHFDKKLTGQRKALYFHLLLALVPSLLWWAASSARSFVIDPYCGTTPQSCSKESVIAIDQLSIGMEDWKADLYSFRTQNLSGTLALMTPAAWHTFFFALGRVSGPIALTSIGIDLVTVLQTITWNGFLTEAAHLLLQRPRPFVYTNPAGRGTDPAHYTSFYSGHTSFSAATTLALIFILMRRKAHWTVLLLAAALAESLVLSTAYFRVLAGRHFLTDVIFGALAGASVAWTIAWVHEKATGFRLRASAKSGT